MTSGDVYDLEIECKILWMCIFLGVSTHNSEQFLKGICDLKKETF